MTTASSETTVDSRQFGSNRRQQTAQKQSVSNSQLPADSSTAISQQQSVTNRQLNINQSATASSGTTSQQQQLSSSQATATSQQQTAQRQPIDNVEFRSNRLNHDDNDNNSPVRDDNIVSTEGVCQTTSLCVIIVVPANSLEPLGRQRHPHETGSSS